jgi:hypothetical protein
VTNNDRCNESSKITAADPTTVEVTYVFNISGDPVNAFDQAITLAVAGATVYEWINSVVEGMECVDGQNQAARNDGGFW